MNEGVVIALFICLVIIVTVGVAVKYDIECNIEHLKTKADYLEVFYHSLDKRWGDMYDADKWQGKQLGNIVNVINGQQEEIKELRRMIEPEEKKKPCCGNCRFYHELNNQDSVCLNVNVNNRHKTETTLYFDNRAISYGSIKGVKPNDYCEYYESKEEEGADR